MKKVFLVGLLLLGGAGLAFLLPRTPAVPFAKTSTSAPGKAVVVPHNPVLLFEALRRFSTSTPPQKMCARPELGIVPHHDLASELIAEVFQTIAHEKKVTRVIIVGPNHSDAGSSLVYSARFDWQTPERKVLADQGVIGSLYKSGVIGLDDKILANEHAAFVPILFVAHYFPEATVVPLIISSKQTADQSFALAKTLTSLLDENTIVIGSIDFSHYLPSDVAVKKDALTAELMKKKDYRRIAQLNNDYVDSPQSVVTMLKLAELRGLNTLELRHTNSGGFMHRQLLSSTSYFALCFGKL